MGVKDETWKHVQGFARQRWEKMWWAEGSLARAPSTETSCLLQDE